MLAPYQTLLRGQWQVVVRCEPKIGGKPMPSGAASVRLISFILLLAALSPNALPKDKQASQYGTGIIVNIPLPVAEVTRAVEEVVGNGIIRGTKEYNKDEYVSGAAAETSTSVFPAWTGEGKIYYKVREQALDPRNFRESGSLGTLAVRYVVLPQGESNTVLRIDAIFEENFRHSVHQSNGTVESSEYKAIQEILDASESLKKRNTEAQREKAEAAAPPSATASTGATPDAPPAPATPAGNSPRPNDQTAVASPIATTAAPTAPEASAESLEQRVGDLRRKVERVVKKPGAPLKSAPFRTAGTLKSLPPGTNVLVVILTPYWFGVETRDGQHGWMERDQLESLP